MVDKDKMIAEYNNFFEETKKFQEKQNKQKQRGLNDYNLLTTVLEAHDEVRLHSRMIGSLLNPDGLHYQNTLFLENFIDELKLDNFELDLENIYIGVEYHNIDLYITDGKKHIIIENKIWADDQPCQIIKYINIIKEEYNLITDENGIIDDMRVIYLTPQNKPISNEHSIIDKKYITFSGGNAKLEDCSKRDNIKALVQDGLKNYKVLFKKIGYKKEILAWLQKCQYEVKNITNLNEAIKQYISVVKIIIGKEETMVDLLEDELLKNQKKLKLAKEISLAYVKALNKQQRNFIDELIKNTERLHLENSREDNDKNSWHCLNIKEKYFIRFFRNEDGVTIQITDVNNPFSIVKVKEKELILKDLLTINPNFKSGWNKVYAVLNIENSNIEEFDFNELISNIIHVK